VPEAMTAPTEIFAAAEVPTISERVVVAPHAGRFAPLPPEVFTADGEWVEPGQVLAEIRNGENNYEVRSPFRGWMMGMLALSGQPVREGEALFWIWSG
jgi:biotin carboxyl carrier protein